MENREKNLIIQKICFSESLECYDPYDIWKTRFGIFIKNTYNKNKLAGIFPAAIFEIINLLFNNLLRFFFKKQEFPIVRAQAAITLINLYKVTDELKVINKAEEHIKWLITNFSTGFSGLCWGIGFEWAALKNMIYSKNEPFTTHTPYCLEAIDLYVSYSSNDEYIRYIESVFKFYENDIKIMFENDSLMSVSYSSKRDRVITNAVSYTLFAYTIFLKYFPNKNKLITKKIKKLYNFICVNQQEDGSWLYTPNDNNSFIDCFHTCFIIKNVLKSRKNIELIGSDLLIKKGMKYLTDNFYCKKTGLYKRFSKKNKPSTIKYDLYDNAEVLNLFALLKKWNSYKNLEYRINKYFICNDHIYSSIDFLNIKRNKNTLRWAVMPYLNSLSKGMKEN